MLFTKNEPQSLATSSFPRLDSDPPRRRFGLIAARIGASIPHPLDVALELDEPAYPTAIAGLGGQARLAAMQRKRSGLAYGTNPRDGSPVAVRALPGTTMYLDVADLTRLEPELVATATWHCLHPSCHGKRHASKDALVAAHGRQRDLIEEAEKDPRGGHAHVYYGAIAVEGLPERRDDKSGVVLAPAQQAATILISDEE